MSGLSHSPIPALAHRVTPKYGTGGAEGNGHRQKMQADRKKNGQEQGALTGVAI